MREQSLSRRGVVASLAVAALSLPALASATGSDDQLFALGSELEQVHAARLAFDEINDHDEDPGYERHWQLREAINRIPAVTVAGVAVKARAAKMALHYDPSNENEGEGAFWDLSSSLIEDLLRIVPTGGAHA